VLLQQLSEQSQQPESDVRELTEQHHAALEQIAADPRAHLFVVEDGGEVVGTLTLYLLPNLSHGGRPYAIVENVVVDGERRGGGYGRLLMRHAERLADEAGCYKLSLTSNVKRAPAHAFYESIGYHNTHRGFTRYAEPATPSD
jgi:GNAT superfamily N-acetyltransferase